MLDLWIYVFVFPGNLKQELYMQWASDANNYPSREKLHFSS
jgi:hypothetical protein